MQQNHRLTHPQIKWWVKHVASICSLCRWSIKNITFGIIFLIKTSPLQCTELALRPYNISNFSKQPTSWFQEDPSSIKVPHLVWQLYSRYNWSKTQRTIEDLNQNPSKQAKENHQEWGEIPSRDHKPVSGVRRWAKQRRPGEDRPGTCRSTEPRNSSWSALNRR